VAFDAEAKLLRCKKFATYYEEIFKQNKKIMVFDLAV
jgi:hypothetical protein